MGRIVFWQGSRGSKAALAIRKALKDAGIRSFRIKSSDSRYVPRADDTIVNWGSSDDRYDSTAGTTLNPSTSVATLANKKRFFEQLDRHGVHEKPLYFTSKEDAREYLESYEDAAIYCRTVLTGNSGRGIVIARTPDELVECKLYTVAVENVRREVRVHVFQDSVLSFSQKKRMSTESREERGIVDEPDEWVRNHDNGWIFAREGVAVSEEIQEKCIEVSSLLGLSFGAFDIVEDEENNFYFLEGNTAPGLQGTTLDEYVDALSSLV